MFVVRARSCRGCIALVWGFLQADADGYHLMQIATRHKFLAKLVFGLLFTLLPSLVARAEGFTVLGVIAATKADSGVVLLQRSGSAVTFAARVGYEIDPGLFVDRITREYVYVRKGPKVERIRVGDQLDSSDAVASASAPAGAAGIERRGNTVRVTASLRDHLVKRELSKILMQAAAVPYYRNGELIGFQLLEIESGSIYLQAGFQEGDIVTAVNEQALTDVGRAIQVLQSMRSETRAEFSFLRDGAAQKLEIVID